jgi:hypothetical protein
MYRISVQRGMGLLDEKAPPGWRDKVSPPTLDMGDPCHCVLAQVFGDYSQGLRELGISNPDYYGFTFMGYPCYGPEFETLTQDWLEQLV